MAWHGPRGSCGCCGGNCTCATTCECREGASFGNLLGYISGHDFTISGFPASMQYSNTPGGPPVVTLLGFDQLNGTYVLPAEPGQNCYTGPIKTATITAVQSTGGCANVVGSVFLRYNSLVDAFQVILDVVDNPIHDPISGCGCNTSGDAELFRLNLSQFPAGRCFGFPEGSAVDSFGGDFSCSGRFLLGGNVRIDAAIATRVSNSPDIPLIGWNYTVSNVPSSFYVRISNTVKSYLITGMDAINGDYELELDDETDCTKSGIEFLTFDITAQEYQVSLSSPCTIVPIGSPVAATARLALPPTSTGVVVTIRIPGENDKSILIDDWVPFGCDGYTEDAYIDHESTECFGNADPILTLTQAPILG